MIDLLLHIKRYLRLFLGLSENCTMSEMFWTREVFTPSQDTPGFSISDRDPDTWLGSNKPRYDPASQEVKYTFNQGDSTIFYWSMPKLFQGIVQFWLNRPLLVHFRPDS